MAKTLIVDATQVRTDLLTYLHGTSFVYSQPRDVANYAALGQVALRMTHGGCEADLVFDCNTAELTSYDRCTDGTAGADRDPEYWAEVQAIGAEFASIAAANSTVQVVRRRDPSLPSPF
jgi:hypothetical protein